MIQIGDRSYYVPAPDGMRSFTAQQRLIPVASRIANVFVPLLGATTWADLADKDVMSVLPLALPRIGEIFSEMPGGELEVIVRTLLGDPKYGAPPGATSTCNKLPLFGGPAGDAFDGLMQGRNLEIWQLLWHALEVWYPDFFARARGLLARSGGKANPSGESSTSATPGLPTA